MTLYEIGPLTASEVRALLARIAQSVPRPFRPRIIGMPDAPQQMRVYLADDALHIATWQVAHQERARDITDQVDHVNASMVLTEQALIRWAERSSAPAAVTRWGADLRTVSDAEV